MPEPLVDSFIALLVGIIGYPLGTPEFYTVFLCACAVWVVVARIIAAVFGSTSGFMRTFFALLLPLGLGVLTYTAIDVHLLPLLDSEALPLHPGWIGFGLVTLLGILIFSTELWSFRFRSSLAVFLVAGIAASGAHYAVHGVFDLIDKGGSRLEERQQRLEEDVMPLPLP